MLSDYALAPGGGIFNIKRGKFLIRSEKDGVDYWVAYPAYHCTKLHPCQTGVIDNQGCSGGNFTKEQVANCAGRMQRIAWQEKEAVTKEEAEDILKLHQKFPILTKGAENVKD